jgi:MFS family permease
VKKPRWLGRSVVVLGLVSLFTDAATEMVIPLLPAFLTTVLHAGPLALGAIEGVADGTASLLKLVSGRLSDRMQRRHPLVLAGYGLSSIARPFLAIAATPLQVFAIRVVDRVGKGIRSSPRDALLAAAVEPGERGRAFGFHRAMDHLGAVIGPLVAFAFLLYSDDLRLLFALTAIPGAIAVAVLAFGIREEPVPVAAKPSSIKPKGIVPVLVPIAIFSLGNASDVFLLLKAGGEHAPLESLPLLWMGLHIVKTVSSLAGGSLADRFGRRRSIVLGWVVYAGIYVGFAFASDLVAVGILFVVYGVYHGLTEGAERALIADLVPAEARGTAFGWYHATVGLATLLASLLFGGLWELFDGTIAFLTSAGLCVVATLLFVAIAGRDRPTPQPTNDDVARP